MTAKRMTPEQRREYVIDFAYGNAAFENPRVTREMVAKAYDRHEADRKNMSNIDLIRSCPVASRRLLVLLSEVTHPTTLTLTVGGSVVRVVAGRMRKVRGRLQRYGPASRG